MYKKGRIGERGEMGGGEEKTQEGVGEFNNEYQGQAH